MDRNCSHCGTSFPAQRPTARYCSSSCRSRASVQRKREGQVAEVVTNLPERPSDPASTLAGTVGRQLEGAKKRDTYAGQQALIIAERMDRLSPLDTGSQVAALSRELDRLMTALLANVAPEADALDTLQGNVVPMRQRRA